MIDEFVEILDIGILICDWMGCYIGIYIGFGDGWCDFDD